MAFYSPHRSTLAKTGKTSTSISATTKWLLEHVEFSPTHITSFEELYETYKKEVHQPDSQVSVSQFSTILQVIPVACNYPEIEKITTRRGVFYRNLALRTEALASVKEFN